MPACHKFERSVPPSRICATCHRDALEHPEAEVLAASFAIGYAHGRSSTDGALAFASFAETLRRRRTTH